MSHLFILRATTLVLTIGSLAGCGSSGLLSSLAATELNALTAGAATSTGTASFDGQQGGRQGKGAFSGNRYAGLTLTADQQTQITAIEAKYRPAPPAAPATAPSVDIKALLAADPLDQAALKTALANRPVPPARTDNHVAEMTEVRAVLTDAQRATLIAKLQAAPAPAPRPSDAARVAPTAMAIATKLSLTAAQTSALQAFIDKMSANKPAAETDNHAERAAAEIAFWQTGDATALTALKPAAEVAPTFAVDEFVALEASLTATQRQQLRLPGIEGGCMGGRESHGRGGESHGRGGEGQGRGGEDQGRGSEDLGRGGEDQGRGSEDQSRGSESQGRGGNGTGGHRGPGGAGSPAGDNDGLSAPGATTAPAGTPSTTVTNTATNTATNPAQ